MRDSGLNFRVMEVGEGTLIELTRSTVALRHGDRFRATKHDESEQLRDASRRFVADLVAAEGWRLFGYACTSCGACCKRPDVLVSAAEIFTLARDVGVSDDTFRKRYLRPSPTWNASDGYLQLQDGHCPFLESAPDGRLTRCSVYEHRPFSCRAFLPVSPICVKTPERLIERLVTIRIEGDRVSVETDEPAWHALEADGQPWRASLEAFLEALRLEDDSVDDRFTRITAGIIKMMAALREELENDVHSATAARQYGELREIVLELSALVELTDADRAERGAILESLWAQVLEIDTVVAASEVQMAVGVQKARNGNGHKPVEPPPASPAGPQVAGVTLFPEVVVASGAYQGTPFQQGIPMSARPDLVASSRRVLEALARWNTPDVAGLLEDSDPPCFLCGECCRAYAVEILPTDVERLAWNLGIPTDEFIERYTQPGRFSLNPGNRILNKVTYQGKRQCVFLEHRDDGFYYCGVHAFKPAVCAGYQPTHRLCHKVNDMQYWDRRIRNVIWLFLEGHEAVLHTHKTHNEGREPLRVDLRRHAPALQASAEVFAAVRAALGA